MALACAVLDGKLQMVVLKSVDARSAVRWLFPVAGLCGMGCAPPGNMTPLNDPPHALTARRSEQVEMFMTARPTRAYVEVALIDGAHLSMARVRECAAQLGCDALYVDMTSRRFQQSICLVYTDARAPAAPPRPSGLWAHDGKKWQCDAGSAQPARDQGASGF